MESEVATCEQLNELNLRYIPAETVGEIERSLYRILTIFKQLVIAQSGVSSDATGDADTVRHIFIAAGLEASQEALLALEQAEALGLDRPPAVKDSR